jgi:leader peptidase (prepilin peptidase)/N-methyltransferase
VEAVPLVWLVVLFSFGFLLGSVLGSFLNVVARRTVAGESWWGKSRSRCDTCGTPLTSSELIPLLSWLVQRGRCRTCGAAIPRSYFYVELVCALIGALVTARWGQFLPESVSNGKALLPLLLASTAAYSLYLNALTDLYSGYIFDLFALAPEPWDSCSASGAANMPSLTACSAPRSDTASSPASSF